MIRCASDFGTAVWRALAYRDALDAVEDPRGRTVRATPRRVTRMQTVPLPDGGVCLFRKLRLGGVADAVREWQWLHELARRGFRVPEPAFLARCGSRTVVATRQICGRPLPALLVEAGADAATAYACSVLATTVRRLHALRLVFRDLYWNHLFADDLADPSRLAFIDVERTLRPRLRWRRWVVKDLAGLVSSWPFEGADLAADFVRAYLGHADAALAAAVGRKAERIRRHVPKYGA